MTSEKNIVLPHNSASFSVTVASPDYGSTGQNSFLYRLLPTGDEWKRLDGNKITFANLCLLYTSPSPRDA